jgi:hypothetical protein
MQQGYAPITYVCTYNRQYTYTLTCHNAARKVLSWIAGNLGWIAGSCVAVVCCDNLKFGVPVITAIQKLALVSSCSCHCHCVSFALSPQSGL